MSILLTPSVALKAQQSKRPSPLKRLQAMIATHRQRRHLASLDEEMLRDIGLTQAEATAEAQKPAWDVPMHWTL